eukprot:TRINITY_DN43837_c0_g1_i1.p1 TRINITY_DN43837_c0_g1~~TRINITY_DN43837_c0_g1_i1.p1  ORF type:complete len:211 (+),score=36.92 TRINITY_DN43837_c0_g1_i1:176-808(+)
MCIRDRPSPSFYCFHFRYRVQSEKLTELLRSHTASTDASWADSCQLNDLCAQLKDELNQSHAREADLRNQVSKLSQEASLSNDTHRDKGWLEDSHTGLEIDGFQSQILFLQRAEAQARSMLQHERQQHEQALTWSRDPSLKAALTTMEQMPENQMDCNSLSERVLELEAALAAERSQKEKALESARVEAGYANHLRQLWESTMSDVSSLE